MLEKIAKIEDTFLGKEDHGIWTAYLYVTYGSSGQGIGGCVLDTPQHDSEGSFLGRIGTAYGMEWIMRITEACGVDSWEKVKGRTILVYTERDGFDTKPVAIGPLPTERGKLFIFSDLKELADA